MDTDNWNLTFMAAAITIVSVILLVIAFINAVTNAAALAMLSARKNYPTMKPASLCDLQKCGAKTHKVLLAPMARCCGSVEAESSGDGSYTAIVAVMVAMAGAAVNKDTGKLPTHFSFTPFYAVFCPLRSAQPRL